MSPHGHSPACGQANEGGSTKGGCVSAVDRDSPAARAGLRPGDVIVCADGHELRDVIDWRWYSDGPEVTLAVRHGDGSLSHDTPHSLTLSRDGGQSWGIEFADVVFDGVRTCSNRCTFCFMTQLPRGLRSSLYVRDDDYRLSFLQGNFVTLTNLTDEDVARMIEQRLSPLHVSIHAVTPSVRERLVRARDDDALLRFDQLLEAGIDMHVQIVLVPGVNDGDELDVTLRWLAEREGVLSVGVVPLGFTRHQSVFTRSYNDPLAAATVIQQVQRWQFAMRERDGVSWAHLADEFYLNARAPFPTSEWYDGFPQYENGIGLVRVFADEAAQFRNELLSAVSALPRGSEAATVVTGVMAATTLAGALNACEASGRVRLLVVPNRFFGGNVAVTGLLTGSDLVAALIEDASRTNDPTVYLIPDVVFNADDVTLDDFTRTDIADRSGVDIRVVSSDAHGLLAGLREVARLAPPQDPCEE